MEGSVDTLLLSAAKQLKGQANRPVSLSDKTTDKETTLPPISGQVRWSRPRQPTLPSTDMSVTARTADTAGIRRVSPNGSLPEDSVSSPLKPGEYGVFAYVQEAPVF
jgi:hypothetical protein